jgi:hypothetical protein
VAHPRAACGHGARDPAAAAAIQSGVGPQTGPPGLTGTVKEKVEPSPRRLRTHRRPPKLLMISREIASPRPLPLGFCVSLSPAWLKF